MAPLRASILASLVAAAAGNVLEGAKKAVSGAMDSCDTDAFEACQAGAVGGERRLSGDFLELRNASNELGRRLKVGCSICGDLEVDHKALFFDPNTKKETRCVDASGYCSMMDCGDCGDLADYFMHHTECCMGGGGEGGGGYCNLCPDGELDRESWFWHPEENREMSCVEAQDFCGENAMACGGCAGVQQWFSESTNCCPGAAGDGGGYCNLCPNRKLDRGTQFWHPDEERMMTCGEAEDFCRENAGAACGGCEVAQQWMSQFAAGCCVATSEGDSGGFPTAAEDLSQEKIQGMFGDDSGGGLGGLAAMTQTADGSTDSPLAVLACKQHQTAIACWEGGCCTTKEQNAITDAWNRWKDNFELMEGQTMPECEIKCAGGEKASDAPRTGASTTLGAVAALALSATTM